VFDVLLQLPRACRSPWPRVAGIFSAGSAHSSLVFESRRCSSWTCVCPLAPCVCQNPLFSSRFFFCRLMIFLLSLHRSFFVSTTRVDSPQPGRQVVSSLGFFLVYLPPRTRSVCPGTSSLVDGLTVGVPSRLYSHMGVPMEVFF